MKNYFKLWWDKRYISKKEHENILSVRLKNQRQNILAEQKRDKDLADELIERLSTLTMYVPDNIPYEIRVEMTVDPALIYRSMSYPGSFPTTEDQRQIARYLSQRFANMIERELITANFLTAGSYREQFELMNRDRLPPDWFRHR